MLMLLLLLAAAVVVAVAVEFILMAVWSTPDSLTND
jgi:hypothetical protein